MPDKKIYSTTAILLGSWLGGPIAGGYFLSQNFAVLGQASLVKKVFWLCIAVTILFMVGIIYIPDNIVDKIPSSLIPITYAFGFYQYAKSNQETALTQHLNNGGKRHSAWRIAGISSLCFLVTVISYIILAVILP